MSWWEGSRWRGVCRRENRQGRARPARRCNGVMPKLGHHGRALGARNSSTSVLHESTTHSHHVFNPHSPDKTVISQFCLFISPSAQCFRKGTSPDSSIKKYTFANPTQCAFSTHHHHEHSKDNSTAHTRKQILKTVTSTTEQSLSPTEYNEKFSAASHARGRCKYV